MKQRISKHRHFVIHYSTIKLEKNGLQYMYMKYIKSHL